MSAALVWLTGQEWFRKVIVVLGLLLGVLLALAGIRRKGEETGRLLEREAQRVEAERTRKRVERVEREMENVPRPSRSDITDRLRKGDF